MKSSKIFVILLMIVLLYSLLSEDDTSAQPYITIESKCELALRNKHDFPKYILEQCKKLLKENDDE